MNFTQKALNRETPVPLYYQLKEILLDAVQYAEAGSSFPTDLELCEQFEISRPTVRQAINELVIEGYLVRMKGRGTFVAEPKIQRDFLISLKSFTEEMSKKGIVPRTKVLVLSTVSCDEQIATALQLSPGSEVVQLERLRYADNSPIVLVVTYLPLQKLPDILLQQFEDASLYDILERHYEYSVKKSIKAFEARTAGAYEARLLEIPEGSPLQLVRTTSYLNDGSPIEYSLALHRGDKSSFTFELHKQQA